MSTELAMKAPAVAEFIEDFRKWLKSNPKINLKDLTLFMNELGGQEFNYYRVRRLVAGQLATITDQELVLMQQFKAAYSEVSKAELFAFVNLVVQASLAGKFAEIQKMTKSGIINHRSLDKWKQVFKQVDAKANELRGKIT